MLGSTGANNFIKHCLNWGELVEDLYLEHLPVGHDVNRWEVKVWTADRDRLEYGVCCVQLRGILCLSRLSRTIININNAVIYTIQAKNKNEDASYQSDLSLLCLHLPPVEEGRAARHHYGVGLLLVLAEAPHTLEVLKEILYWLNYHLVGL